MRATFWGTRGSIATPGPETTEYGGDTSCVTISGNRAGHLLILDAGSGIRRLGATLDPSIKEIDLLLTHLHIDHIVGLGFFAPLFRRDISIRIWAPPATTSLPDRLGRFLSPPLFPVRLRDVASDLELRDMPKGEVHVGEFAVTSAAVIHPDPAVGYRIHADGRSITYLPDHEPALSPDFPSDPEWTSGAALAFGTDLLIHDAQYTTDDYSERVGWGHSSVSHAVSFAELVEARTLVLFHHDPARDDRAVDRLLDEAREQATSVGITAAHEGDTIDLGAAP
jgi:phosphoribosyl 1,2-cyclic phosphodiesterase